MNKKHEFFPRAFNRQEMVLYHYSRLYCDDFRLSRQEVYEDMCIASEKVGLKPCAFPTFCANVADMVDELSELEIGHAVPRALSVLPPAGTPESLPALDAVFSEVAVERLQRYWPEYAEA